MLVSLTVGKVDAGVTVLLTPDKRLIEFPSILLPPSISSGSIVDITVGRNNSSESAAEASFRTLQERIFHSFGKGAPKPPVLRCRNATQTSVVLEWDLIELATADLLSLSLYRNGQKAGAIPRPLAMHSTKISGLAVDTEYTFHLVLRTTAGTHSSERVTVRTHKMTDLSGVTITMGITPATTRDALVLAVNRIGAKIVDGVRIDTTHFVTTEGRGLAWEKAVDMNIPVVRPEWVDACEKTGRILGVTKFYLDAVRAPGDFGMGTPTTTTTQMDSSSPTTTMAADRRISMPAQEQEKSLPSPPSEDPQVSGGRNGDTSEKDMQRKEEGAGGDSSVGVSSEDEEDEVEGDHREKMMMQGRDRDRDMEQKAQLPDLDDQKVWLEEKDTPIRPVALEPSKLPTDDDDNDDDDGNDSNDEEERGEKGRKNEKGTGGDGSSFQDVAL